jgi:hypothetical protein
MKMKAKWIGLAAVAGLMLWGSSNYEIREIRERKLEQPFQLWISRMARMESISCQSCVGDRPAVQAQRTLLGGLGVLGENTDRCSGIGGNSRFLAKDAKSAKTWRADSEVAARAGRKKIRNFHGVEKPEQPTTNYTNGTNGSESCESCKSCNPVWLGSLRHPKIRNFHGVENGTANYEMRERKREQPFNYELHEWHE